MIIKSMLKVFRITAKSTKLYFQIAMNFHHVIVLAEKRTGYSANIGLRYSRKLISQTAIPFELITEIPNASVSI